jgi:hypothetical protein
MIEIVLTVCALSTPSQCEERRLPFVSQGSLMQCVMQAPSYLATWVEEHPGKRVVRWRCAYPGSDGEKA